MDSTPNDEDLADALESVRASLLELEVVLLKRELYRMREICALETALDAE